MNVEYSQLDPALFLKMLRAGARQVIAHEATINQLNVFPVSDHDTGTNLAALMRYFLAQSFPQTQFSEFLNAVADAMLSGACGNSGMIFSAFFTGFARENTIAESLSIADFVQRLQSGVKSAYESVLEPVEGTMLTVMSVWAKVSADCEKNVKDFSGLFSTVLPQVKAALLKTQSQLAVLTRNHVIDAGGLGFFEFICGMHQVFCTKSHEEDEAEFLEQIVAEQACIHEERPVYHYCAETLIEGFTGQTQDINQKLSHLGDSLVVGKSPSHCKVHLHTNDVKQMTEILQKHGEIYHQKIDSMLMQWTVVHARKHRIAIVTDSSADLPQNMIQEKQIHVLPVVVRLGKHALLDKLTVDLPSVFDSLQKKMNVSTATPTPESVRRYLGYLSEHYDSIIVLTISSRLSGVYQMISQAAKNLPDKKITVIDSKNTSAAHGLLVMKAGELVEKGYTHEEIIQSLRDSVLKTHLYVAVNDFSVMVQSGRISSWMGWIAAFSRIKPLITLNREGKAALKSVALGGKSCLHKLIQLTKKNLISSPRIAVVYSGDRAEAEKFKNELEKTIAVKIDYIVEASCAISLHAGKNCIAVAIG